MWNRFSTLHLVTSLDCEFKWGFNATFSSRQLDQFQQLQSSLQVQVNISQHGRRATQTADHATAALPDIPSTPDAIKFLEDRCKALELLQANQLPGTSTFNDQLHQERRSVNYTNVIWLRKVNALYVREPTDCINATSLSTHFHRNVLNVLSNYEHVSIVFNHTAKHMLVQIVHVGPAIKDIILWCIQPCKFNQLIARDQQTITMLALQLSKTLLQ